MFVADVKKIFCIIIFTFSCLFVFGQEFIFPPELQWWLSEIKKIDNSIDINDFNFSLERTIKPESKKISYTNKLYPVLKKWNFYGNQFAYQDIYCQLVKEKNGKYSVLADIDSVFGIFDRNENLLFSDFFGSSSWLNSICWITDSRIVGVGPQIIQTSDDTFDVDFTIYDYKIEKSKITVKEYTYRIENLESKTFSNLKFNWYNQRSDYFEN